MSLIEIKYITRIVKQGNSHYINLPTRFVNKYNLKEKDNLYINFQKINEEKDIIQDESENMLFINRIIKFNNSYYINLPVWFMKKYSLKIKDDLYMKFKKI